MILWFFPEPLWKSRHGAREPVPRASCKPKSVGSLPNLISSLFPSAIARHCDLHWRENVLLIWTGISQPCSVVPISVMDMCVGEAHWQYPVPTALHWACQLMHMNLKRSFSRHQSPEAKHVCEMCPQFLFFNWLSTGDNPETVFPHNEPSVL